MTKDNANSGNGKKVALGTLIGAAGGFAAGILFAPKSGKETRTDIKEGFEKAAAKVHQETDELVAQAKKLETSLAGKSKDELDKLKTAAEQARSKVVSVAQTTAAKKDDQALQAALDDANNAVKNLKQFIKNVTKK